MKIIRKNILEVYHGGVKGLADEITRIKEYYTPCSQVFKYKSFIKYSRKDHVYTENNIQNSWDLMLKGSVENNILESHMADEYYVLNRDEAKKVIANIDADNTTVNILHSDLGNGKTCVFQYLISELSCNSETHVFVYNNKYKDIICEIQEMVKLPGKKVLFLENYNYYIPLLKQISKYIDHNFHFVLTARSYININFINRLRKFFNAEKIYEFDLNKLSNGEIAKVIKKFKLMKINAFYHMNDGLCRKYIVETCHRQWSDLLIDTFTNEKNISKKITEVFDDIKDNNKIVQLILASIINNIVPLNLDYNDILNVLEISRLSIKVTQDENINTFIQIKDGCIQLKSSLLAVYMIRTLDLYDELLTVMEKMIRTSDKLHSNSTENIKRQLISTSNICEMFYKYETDFKSYDKILTFFSNIQEMNYYEDNEYFWLQYAMVCLDAASIDNNFYIRAENYFKTSYDILKRKKMDTYQTDVQYSRFLLERRMSGFADMDSPYETIVQAYNKLVNSYKSSRSEDYYIFKQIPLYKSFTEKFCERLSFKDCESLDKLFDKFIRLIRCNIKKRSTGSTEAEKVIEILSECKMILVRQQIACNIQI